MEKGRTGRAIHLWEALTRHEARLRGWVMSDSVRVYYCLRCGAGPVAVGAMAGKHSINETAKKSWISSDCNEELVKRVMVG